MATVGILNLRCTISGGLEDLATEELQQAFSSSSHRLFWIQKRNSGSQLGLQISDVVSVSTVADVIRKLRFVEYAHCVVHSQEYPMEDTPLPAPEGTNIGDATRAVPSQEKRPLSQIQAQSPSSMEPVQLHRAMSMSRNIRNTLRDRSVGLESLPGDLLPTPVVDGTAAKDELWFKPLSNWYRNAVRIREKQKLPISYGLMLGPALGHYYEAQQYFPKSGPFFHIAGDKSETGIQQASERLSELERQARKTPLVDLVLWNAQRLPIRRDGVDVFLVDLPFTGSQSKKHQVPSSHNRRGETAHVVSPLNYRYIMAPGVRIL